MVSELRLLACIYDAWFDTNTFLPLPYDGPRGLPPQTDAGRDLRKLSERVAHDLNVWDGVIDEALHAPRAFHIDEARKLIGRTNAIHRWPIRYIDVQLHTARGLALAAVEAYEAEARLLADRREG